MKYCMNCRDHVTTSITRPRPSDSPNCFGRIVCDKCNSTLEKVCMIHVPFREKNSGRIVASVLLITVLAACLAWFVHLLLGG